MTQLSPEARRLIRLARPHDEPSRASLQHIEHSLASRIARGVGLSAAGALWAQSASGVALGTSKLVVIAALTGAASAVGIWALPAHSPAPVVTASARVVKPPAVRVPLRPQTPIAVTSDSSVAVALADDVPVQAATTSRPMPRGSQPNTSTKSIEAPDLLREETRELRSAQQALRTGNAGLALKLLAEQDRTFNNGLLQEERAAARVLALCQTGQTDIAKVEAARFEKRWPKSALVARVRSSCF